MPPAEGNFDDKLTLIWKGKGVAAHGPVGWGDEKTAATTAATLHVAIMQNNVVATGRTGDDIPGYATEFLVVAAVQGNGTLSPGPAIATGWALVRGEGVEMYEWSVPVELVERKWVELVESAPATLPEALSPAEKAHAHA
jgi:hypothetical protein